MADQVIVRRLVNGGQVFFCPGCESTHAVNSHPNGPRWGYNNDPVKPTFRPNILVTLRWSEQDPSMTDEVCHSFVTDGRIQFLADSTHKLAGQAVALPRWPYARGSYGGLDDVNG